MKKNILSYQKQVAAQQKGSNVVTHILASGDGIIGPQALKQNSHVKGKKS